MTVKTYSKYTSAARLRMLGLAVLAVLATSGPPGTAAAGAAPDEARGPAAAMVDSSRIVSIGGAVTEILFALGVGDRVIAVDQTSRYPAAARGLPNVGYARALAPEGVLSAGPSVIVAIEGAGPYSTIDVLKHASVPVVIVPEAHDVDSVVRRIEIVAAAVGEPEKGRALADAVRADFAAVAAAISALENRPHVVFVLSTGNGTAVVGGADTSADAMLRLAGVDNAMSGLKGYKPAVDEAAMAADPDAVVVMRGGGQVLDARTVLSLPAFAGTPAARDQRFVSLPGSYLLGFGPRTPQAVRDLAVALHGADLPALPPRPWAVEPDE